MLRLAVTIIYILGRIFRLILRAVGYLITLFVLLFLLQRSTYPVGLQWNAISITVSDYHFDYIGWELSALAAKVDQTLFGAHPFMDEESRTSYVRDYAALMSQVQQLEAQINAIYIDPAVSDPGTASAELRSERNTLREELRSRQNLAEAILEGQVAAVLVEQGFGIGGQLLPPISMRFTEMPNLLIVSPRDEIRFNVSINLYPMPIDKKVALESRIDGEQDVSSLIVPLGGMALYPAMIQESAHIPWMVEVFAHEWVHHYLIAFPLGYNYLTIDSFAGEARLINETTANLFGKEIARLVLERYYPDLLPPPPPEQPATSQPPANPEPPAFDYGAEMNETRVTVDDLLAEGQIEEAETYMEERRALFVANGYRIRKINQAYFAFYGGYQSATPGAAGEDPIGPAVHDLRRMSPTLHSFIVAMRGITTREGLLTARDELAAGQ